MESVVSEFEGVLLKDPDPFSYFMLLAFEASGLIRFTILLLLWPMIHLLHKLGNPDAALKLSIFISVAGIRESEIKTVAIAVLPKFYMSDLDTDAWKMFSSFKKRIVVTGMPRLMVERFAKDHLRADGVVGAELVVNRFGFATGFIKKYMEKERVAMVAMSDPPPRLAMVRLASSPSHILDTCKEKYHPPFSSAKIGTNNREMHPVPIIFHDGRLVKKPTPLAALIIIIWIPFGIILATARIFLGLMLPISTLFYFSQITGVKISIKGSPPDPIYSTRSGVLFVCTHRTLMDPVILSTVLRRRIPTVTYSISRFTEILAPIPTVRLTRNRALDAVRIQDQLSKGDLVMCPEGTTCREPYLLRFSALFAEMAERIIPVAMDCRLGFFHATTARGWKGLDSFFFFMNPKPTYEVTFLKELAPDTTFTSGRSTGEIASYVQRMLAQTLGFECTDFTRRDKYRLLAGNDGDVTTSPNSSFLRWRM